MKKNWPVVFLCAIAMPCSAETNPLSNGIQAFQHHRWQDAMDSFLAVLRQEPQNKQAHSYINLLVDELQVHRRTMIQEARQELLWTASKRMESSWMDAAPVEKALMAAQIQEASTKQSHLHAWCEQAREELELGHLLKASAGISKVLLEDSGNIEAQQLLADLQSLSRSALEQNKTHNAQERYALEGFYAFGQADYATATRAWAKAHVLLQTLPADEVNRQLATLQFVPFEQVAQSHLTESREKKEMEKSFEEGISLYQQGRWASALDRFQTIALKDPAYPNLASYLTHTEAALEKQRIQEIGAKKRQEIADRFAEGYKALEQARYSDAENALKQVLTLDPSHTRARTYLEMVEGEINRRHDPTIAQKHYEAGLIAYASGKLDDAVREWTIVIRMDPGHEKAQNALSKAQKELALYREVP